MSLPTPTPTPPTPTVAKVKRKAKDITPTPPPRTRYFPSEFIKASSLARMASTHDPLTTGQLTSKDVNLLGLFAALAQDKGLKSVEYDDDDEAATLDCDWVTETNPTGMTPTAFQRDQKRRKVHKKGKRPSDTIIIEIEGGVLQNVYNGGGGGYKLIDHDSNDDGAYGSGDNFPTDKIMATPKSKVISMVVAFLKKLGARPHIYTSYTKVIHKFCAFADLHTDKEGYLVMPVAKYLAEEISDERLKAFINRFFSIKAMVSYMHGRLLDMPDCLFCELIDQKLHDLLWAHMIA